MCPTPATAAAAEILARSAWFEQLSAQCIGDIVSRQWLDEHSRQANVVAVGAGAGDAVDGGREHSFASD